MNKQTEKNKVRKNKFKVGDMVSIKIDCVEMTSPLHSNLLLGKIEEIVTFHEKTYINAIPLNALKLTPNEWRANNF